MNEAVKTTNDYLATLPSWQSDNLNLFRDLIHEVRSDVNEEIKWGVPAFTFHSKVIFTMAAFKNHTKYNFILNGAKLTDTNHVFNNGLDSLKSRSIDLSSGDQINKIDLEILIKQAFDIL